MSNTITEKITSATNYYTNNKNISTKTELSDELKEYIENSSSEGKKLLNALKSLSKNGESLSSLVSSNTSDEAVLAYTSGNTNVKTLVSAFNNLLKYSKNNNDNPKLNQIYKSLKNYAKQETDSLKNFGITVKSNGSLSISNSNTLKSSIANGTLGKYILTQNESNSSFLGRLQNISRTFSYNNLSYISDENIMLINAYNTSTSQTNNSSTKTSSQSMSTDKIRSISYYA